MFWLEAVLDDLPIERAAADLEEPGRFLLVPRRGIEHADDVRAFGLAQASGRRGGVVCGGRRLCAMQKLDVAVADDAARRRQRRARHRALQLADVARASG